MLYNAAAPPSPLAQPPILHHTHSPLTPDPPTTRALALKRWNALLLYEYRRDSSGMPIAGTQRRFNLTAAPRLIGQESVGLGVYFTTIILFCLLTFFQSILSIYPIVENSRQQGYSHTFDVGINGIASGQVNTSFIAPSDYPMLTSSPFILSFSWGQR